MEIWDFLHVQKGVGGAILFAIQVGDAYLTFKNVIHKSQFVSLQWNIRHLKADPGFTSVRSQESRTPSLSSTIVKAMMIGAPIFTITIMQTN